ncbi:hypothetical protein HHI36_011550 [Cryptolaemus montrouzieri]|uniref:Secreted protein n=1 Tax=Cryptolaemus montrouzieri TaxID=559131 RepID=A0ABD2MLZ7_9CUCU
MFFFGLRFNIFLSFLITIVFAKSLEKRDTVVVTSLFQQLLSPPERTTLPPFHVVTEQSIIFTPCNAGVLVGSRCRPNFRK